MQVTVSVHIICGGIELRIDDACIARLPPESADEIAEMLHAGAEIARREMTTTVAQAARLVVDVRQAQLDNHT